MKKYILWCLCGTLLLFIGCRGERVIEYPEFGVWSNPLIEIDRIVLNDTASIFYMNAKKCTQGLRGLDTSACLIAGGKKLNIQRAEGIELPADCRMLRKIDTTQYFFKLFFPPVPASLKTVDLLLSQSEEGTQIWDICLEQKRPQKTGGVTEMRKPDLSREWKSPELVQKPTSLTLHVLGYKPGMRDAGHILWKNFFSEDQKFILDEKGEATVAFAPYGAVSVRVSYGQLTVDMLVQSGEKAEVYLDLRESSRRQCSYRQDQAKRPVARFEGRYADLNQTLADKELRTWGGFPKDYQTVVSGMSGEEFVDYCVQLCREEASNVARMDSLSRECQYYLTLQSQMNCLLKIVQMDRHWGTLCMSREELKNTGKKIPGFESKYLQRLKELDLNRYDFMVLSLNIVENVLREVKSLPELQEIFGTDQGYWFDGWHILKMGPRLYTKFPLNEAELAGAENLSPGVKGWIVARNDQNIRAWKEHITKPGYRICSVPAVPDEKLWETIMAGYKGKVVLVDFWATWCGPCCEAMVKMHPLKEELKNEPVAFVYITGETSPLDRWQQAIPDIGGDHFRLTNKQLKYINKQLGVERIPHYMVYNKDGEQTYSKVSFMGCDVLRQLLKKEF